MLNKSFLGSLVVLLGCTGADIPVQDTPNPPPPPRAMANVPTGADDVESEPEANPVDPDPVDASAPPVVTPTAPGAYSNPVLKENGDPFCARFGDTYYLYLPEQVRSGGTAMGGRVVAYTSKDLVTWKPAGVVFDNVDETRGSQASIGLWAPAVLSHGGKYYLYYASLWSGAKDENVGDKDIVVVESSDPLKFGSGKRTVLLDDDYAFIDPSPFVDDGGKLYLYYKKRGATGSGSELNVRPMMSPTAFSGPPKLLVDSDKIPDAEHTVEHPNVWREGSTYFLLFSKGDGGGTGYAIAYATASDPMGPFTQKGVLFRSDTTKVISPGASSIVKDGADRPWMIYRQKTTTKKTFADRNVTLDPVTFDPQKGQIGGSPTRGVMRPAPTPLP